MAGYANDVARYISDLKAEKGNLQIDDDVMKEAGMLVHRKFGTSKRIAELDKKEMQELIAVKIQISKEEWKDEIGTLQKEIHRLEAIIEHEEKKARDVDALLQKFMRDNQSKLMSLAHGNKSTTDVLRTSDPDDDVLAVLRTHIKSVIARTKVVLDERDLLFDDRERCFEALGVNTENGDSSKHALHDLIRQKSGTKPEPTVEGDLREKLAEKEKLIQRLRKISSEYEAEIDDNDRKVKGVKDELAAVTTENLALKSKMKEMERDMEELRHKARTTATTTASSNGNGKKGRRPSKS